MLSQNFIVMDYFKNSYMIVSDAKIEYPLGVSKKTIATAYVPYYKNVF